MAFRQIIGIAAAVSIVATVPAFAETIGNVLRVEQGAVLIRDGQALQLVRRAGLENGDVIRTDAQGSVQLIFQDRTRLAIGPSSELLVDEYREASEGRASRVALDALGGTFRFLSGRSPKEAYEITTPTATMGVRGTIFDFAVVGNEVTNLVTFRGEVEICEAGRRCARVSGGCTTVVAAPRRGVSTLPTREDKLNVLATRFPFVVSQERLGLAFRAQTWTCGDVKSALPVTPTSVQPRGNVHQDASEPDGGYSESGDERD